MNTACLIHQWSGVGQCPQCAVIVCENCKAAPSTDNWGGTHDQLSLARNPHLVKRWCHRCVLIAQRDHLRTSVPRLAKVEAELAALDQIVSVPTSPAPSQAPPLSLEEAKKKVVDLMADALGRDASNYLHIGTQAIDALILAVSTPLKEEIERLKQEIEKQREQLKDADQVIAKLVPLAPVTDDDVAWAQSVVATSGPSTEET